MRRLMDVALALETPVAGELLLAGISDTNVDRAEPPSTCATSRETPRPRASTAWQTWCKNGSVMTSIFRPNCCWRSTRVSCNADDGGTGRPPLGHLVDTRTTRVHRAIKLHWRRPRPGRAGLGDAVDRRVAERSAWSPGGKTIRTRITRRSPWLAQRRNSSDGRRNENYITSCHPAASLSPACCVPSRSPRRPSCVFSLRPPRVSKPRHTTRISFVSSMPKPVRVERAYRHATTSADLFAGG